MMLTVLHTRGHISQAAALKFCLTFKTIATKTLISRLDKALAAKYGPRIGHQSGRRQALDRFRTLLAQGRNVLLGLVHLIGQQLEQMLGQGLGDRGRSPLHLLQGAGRKAMQCTGLRGPSGLLIGPSVVELPGPPHSPAPKLRAGCSGKRAWVSI